MRISLVYPVHQTSSFDVGNGYYSALKYLGHTVIPIPFYSMMKDWAEFYRFFWIIRGETDVKYTTEDIIKRCTAEAVMQIVEQSPDIVFIVDGTSFHRIGWEWLRKVRIPIVLIGTESPYNDDVFSYCAQYADLAYSNDKTSAEKIGIPYLPLGYDKFVHRPMCVIKDYQRDVVFVGSGFKERIDMLSGVNWNGIDFIMFGHYPIDHDHILAPYYKDAMIPNLQAAMYYAGSKISLNLARVSKDYEGTMRMDVKSLSARPYEVPACGGFLLTEFRKELYDLFPEDIVQRISFTTPAELDSQIRYWLKHDEERAEVSKTCKMLVNGHSYVNRAECVLRDLANLAKS